MPEPETPTLTPETLHVVAEAWSGFAGAGDVYELHAHADAWELREMALKAALEENATLYRRLEALERAALLLYNYPGTWPYTGQWNEQRHAILEEIDIKEINDHHLARLRKETP